MNDPARTESLSSKLRRFFTWHRIALGLIIILGTVLRLWRLEELPAGLQHDEAYNGLDALALLNGETFPIFHEGWELYADEAHSDRPVYESKWPPFFEGNYGREPGLIYLSAASIMLIDATVRAIRIVPALFGILSVLVVYLVARGLEEKISPQDGNRPIEENYQPFIGPLVAAFIMATIFPTLAFSRIGFREILFVPIGGITVYFFWKGILSAEAEALRGEQNGEEEMRPLPLGSFKPGWFGAAGLFLGLGIYTFAAARFMPLAFAVFYFIWWLQDSTVAKRHWTNFLTMAGVSVVISLPVLLFLIRQPYYLIYRSRVVANRGSGTYPGRPWITWAMNVPRVLFGLIWQGDNNILHNLPGRSYLDPIQLVLIVVGGIDVIRQRKWLRNQFLAIWVIVMLMPSIFSGDAPHFGRMLGAAMPFSIIIGIGVSWIITYARVRLESKSEKFLVLVSGLILLLVAASGIFSIRDYFGRYAEQDDLAEAFNESDWQLGQYAASLPEEAAIYLAPTQVDMASILFAFAGKGDQIRSFYSPEQTLIPAGRLSGPVYYLIREHDEATLEGISRYLPGGIIDQPADSFKVYSVPMVHDTSPDEEGLGISWGGAISLEDWHYNQADRYLDVRLTWKALVPMERSYTVFVHLLSEEGDLVTQLDRLPDGYPTSDWQEGELVIDTYRLQLPPEIQPGKFFLQTGFYHLPTSERIGEPQILGEVEIE